MDGRSERSARLLLEVVIVFPTYIVIEQVCESCNVINDHLTQDCPGPMWWDPIGSVLIVLAWLNTWLTRRVGQYA